EEDDGHPAERAGDGGPADEHRHAAGDAAPHDVLRGAALEDERVDDDVEEDRRHRESRREPRREDREDDGRDHRERPGEHERFARSDFAGDEGSAPRALHDAVDVAVEVAVEGVGAASRQRAADEGRNEQPQERQIELALGGEHHDRGGRHEKQLDDARLHEGDVGERLAFDADPTENRYLGHVVDRTVGRRRSGGALGGLLHGSSDHSAAIQSTSRDAEVRPSAVPAAECPSDYDRGARRLRALPPSSRRGCVARAVRRRSPNRRADTAPGRAGCPASERSTFVAALSWDPIDDKAVDTARILAADAVEKVGNGHPGTAMSLAPAAYLLYQKV